MRAARLGIPLALALALPLASTLALSATATAQVGPPAGPPEPPPPPPPQGQARTADGMPVYFRGGKTLVWAAGGGEIDEIETFDLSGSDLDPRRLELGPDAVPLPPLDEPSFVLPHDAKLIAAGVSLDSRVLGVAWKGEARAYPLDVLELHQVVNDRFGSEAVLVCWSPLARLGAALPRKVGSATPSFAPTGYVLDRRFLLYDRETRSLWYPDPEGTLEAVAGERDGSKLVPFATPEPVTLRSWLAENSDTKVLFPSEAAIAEMQRGFLGIELELDGVTVRHVFPGSGAAWAGIEVGDRILRINALETPNGAALQAAMAGGKVGDLARVVIGRHGRTEAVDVRLGERQVRRE